MKQFRMVIQIYDIGVQIEASIGIVYLLFERLTRRELCGDLKIFKTIILLMALVCKILYSALKIRVCIFTSPCSV